MSRRGLRPGFTLLEMILALSIGLVLLGALYMTLNGQLFQAQAGRDVVEEGTLARAILTRIANDILGHLGDPGQTPESSSSTSTTPASTDTTAATGTTPSATTSGSTTPLPISTPILTFSPGSRNIHSPSALRWVVRMPSLPLRNGIASPVDAPLKKRKSMVGRLVCAYAARSAGGTSFV